MPEQNPNSRYRRGSRQGRWDWQSWGAPFPMFGRSVLSVEEVWRKYDRIEARLTAPVSERMVDLAGLQPGMRVLDLRPDGVSRPSSLLTE